MFVKVKYRGYKGKVRDPGRYIQGFYLVLFCRPGASCGDPLRALVLYVKLRVRDGVFTQHRRILDKTVVLEGNYGGDGCPIPLPEHLVWDELVELPEDLAKLAWRGGSPDGIHTEADLLRKWAKANYKLVRYKELKRKAIAKKRAVKAALSRTE